MLVGIFGNLGSGKTLLEVMLAWLYKYKKEAFVASNFRLVFADLVLSAEELLMQISDLGKGHKIKALFLDELGRILTATDWYTDVNTILGKIFTESRKRGYDIIYTSQSALMVDRNVRRITDIVLLPDFNDRTKRVTVQTHESKGLFWLQGDDLNFDGSLYFDFYDTNEIITPNKVSIVNYYADKLKDNSELMKRIEKLKAKADKIDFISFHLSIKTKLSKLVYFEIQEYLAE